jgi:hypothetical protein
LLAFQALIDRAQNLGNPGKARESAESAPMPRICPQTYPQLWWMARTPFAAAGHAPGDDEKVPSVTAADE